MLVKNVNISIFLLLSNGVPDPNPFFHVLFVTLQAYLIGIGASICSDQQS